MKPQVKRVIREVWFAPTAGRHYFSKWAAAVGEARARIQLKHPTIPRFEFDDGDGSGPGWTWQQLPHAERLLHRYARKIQKGIK